MCKVISKTYEKQCNDLEKMISDLNSMEYSSDVEYKSLKRAVNAVSKFYSEYVKQNIKEGKV